MFLMLLINSAKGTIDLLGELVAELVDLVRRLQDLLGKGVYTRNKFVCNLLSEGLGLIGK